MWGSGCGANRVGKRRSSLPSHVKVAFVLCDTVQQRQELLRAVWGTVPADNNLDVTMSSLRAKVDPAGGRRLIHTVRGFGHKITE